MWPRIGITTSPDVINDRPHDTLNRAYVDAVVRAGGAPILIPVLEPTLVDAMLGGLDGIILSGGSDIDPATYHEMPDPSVYGVNEGRDAWEIALACAAIERGVPVLAICRGAQVVNVAHGGTLVQHLPAVTTQVHRDTERFADEVHRVDIERASLLADVLGTTEAGVNTLHHQAVRDLGAGLRAVAWAHDGTIEAIESATRSAVLGVQWHPELLVETSSVHRRLFEWIVERADRVGSHLSVA